MIHKNIETLIATCKSYKEQGKSIVRTNGCFDIIHPGHIKTFEESKALGDVLIVGVNGDASPYFKTKPGRPINSEKFRSIMLDSIKYITEVFIYDDETPLAVIQAILPDILVKGGDYEVESIVGYEDVIKNGGKVVTVPIEGDYSTTQIVTKIIDTYQK